MIIRCPNCEYSRTININAVPQTAELATCPKCRHRFRFRTLTAALDEEEAARRDAPPPPPPRPAGNGQSTPSGSQGLDIWDAVDALNQQWERQMEQHVTEVVTPVPQAAAQAAERQPGAARPQDQSLFVEMQPKEAQPKAAEPAGPQARAGERAAPYTEAASNAAPPRPEAGGHAAMQAENEESASIQAAAAFQGASKAQAEGIAAFQAGLSLQTTGAAASQDDPGTQAEASQSGSALQTGESAGKPVPDSAAPAAGQAPFTPGDQGGSRATEQAVSPAMEQDSAGADAGIHTDAAARHAPGASAPILSPESTHTMDTAARTGQDEQAGASAVFPYAYDDTSPEERVERDILLLRGSDERPLRDLGRLDEYGATGGGSEDDGAAGGDIPWEMPEKYGWIQAFIKSIHEVMFNAPSFFSRLRPSGSLASEYLFFLLLGYIGILGSVAWTRTALLLIPSLREDTGPSLSLPAVLLLAPLALGLMQVCVTGGIRIIQRLLSSDPLDFSLVFKIVSYSVAPFVLSVVPFVGPVVGAIWFLATLFIGCRHGLGLSWRRAVAVPLFPALVLIYGVAWYFL